MSKPILFNTEMVRAILAGQKTATRRLITTRRKDACGFKIVRRYHDRSIVGVVEYDENERMLDSYMLPPYKVGDELYVRETFAMNNIDNRTKYLYKADYDVSIAPYCNWKWKPSLHMPKEAARIKLLVTYVGIERLQNCSDAESKLEGCKNQKDFIRVWNSTVPDGTIDKNGWDANPWVWVIRFKKC